MNACKSKNGSYGHKSEVLCPILDDRFGERYIWQRGMDSSRTAQKSGALNHAPKQTQSAKTGQ